MKTTVEIGGELYRFKRPHEGFRFTPDSRPLLVLGSRFPLLDENTKLRIARALYPEDSDLHLLKFAYVA